MGRTVRELLKCDRSYDETDRMPDKITTTKLDIFSGVLAITRHFVEFGANMNVAMRYYSAGMMTEFGWTLAFVCVPDYINTTVLFWKYSQDRQQDSLSNESTKRKWLRVLFLVLQMDPILRFADALIHAAKSRRAEREKDPGAQRKYQLILKDDSDDTLLRIFECLLGAAPQLVLQISLLLRDIQALTVHQHVSIGFSISEIWFGLLLFHNAVRFTSKDKSNTSLTGDILQTIWHLLVTFSRIISIAIIAFLYPICTILACAIHIFTTAILIQTFNRSPFCLDNRFGDIAFSVALGAVYLFTYILPVEGRTRYRYAIYYSICFIQNTACGIIWYVFGQKEIYFYPLLAFTFVPYIVGLIVMVIYYRIFHPEVVIGER